MRKRYPYSHLGEIFSAVLRCCITLSWDANTRNMWQTEGKSQQCLESLLEEHMQQAVLSGLGIRWEAVLWPGPVLTNPFQNRKINLTHMQGWYGLQYWQSCKDMSLSISSLNTRVSHCLDERLAHRWRTVFNFKLSRTEAVKEKKNKPFLALTPAVQHPLTEDTNPDDQFNLYCNRMWLLDTKLLTGNNDK